MNEIDEFISVVGSLSVGEKKDVRNRLLSQKGDARKNISLKLFDLVCERCDLSSKNLILLFGGSSIVTFKKLISRVLEKILDVLILKDNIIQFDLYDERTKDIFLLERQLIISEILRYRGLFKISNQYLEKVISQCKYYEHYDILLYALEKKRRWLFMILNDSECNKLEIEIEFYQNAKIQLKNSNELFLKIVRFNVESFDHLKKKYILNGIERINKYGLKINSHSIKYYLLFIKIHYNNLSMQYNKSIQFLDELIELIVAKRNIYSKHKHGNALLNKGLFYRYKFEYELSIQNINESRKYLLDKKQNNIIIYEQLYLTYFYVGDLAKIRYYLSLIEREYANDGFKYFSSNKYYLYAATYNILIRKFDQSTGYLNQISMNSNEILFNLNLKILSILNFIELNKLDLADAHIENLRKYISRIKISDLVIKRRKIILKIFLNLSALSFDFAKAKMSQEDSLKQLRTLSGRFVFYDYEMILFHEWFESKAKNVPYDHAEVMARLRKANKPRRIK